MQRFERYLHRGVVMERLRDAEHLDALEVRGRWIPDPLEAFDEIDLALPLDGDRDLVLTLAVENGNIERMLLGWAPSGDDDADPRAFSGEELAAVLGQAGEAVRGLLEYLTT